MDAMQTIIALIFAPTSIVAVVAWILTKYFEKTLSRDLEGYKARLNNELEQSKVRLAHELETKSFEHQTRFTLFYQKQAEVIEKIYTLLVNYRITMEDLRRSVQFAGEKSLREQITEAGEAYNDLAKYFYLNRIYIDEVVCEKIDAVLKTKHIAYNKYMIDATQGNISSEKLSIWMETVEVLQREVPSIGKELENQFRQILSTGLPATTLQATKSASSDN